MVKFAKPCVSQDLIMRPLRINIYVGDVFLTLKNNNACSFTEDTTKYSYNDILEKV